MLQNQSINPLIDYWNWHKVAVFDSVPDLDSEKSKWCSDRLSFPGQYNGWSRVYYGFSSRNWADVTNYYFRNKEDATAFALTFGKDICYDYK